MASTIIPYDVVYCTSEDPERPIANLRGGDPDGQTGGETTLLGWQSARNGKTPQTLVLRFPGVVWLNQLRILSHESKIASNVEVRVFKLGRTDGDGSTGDLDHPPSYRTARFIKLGTFDLNSNEHSKYKAKERKTVHLKTEAYFLKLLLDRPYENALNVDGQVGLYSIECVGYLVAPVRHHVDRVVEVARSFQQAPSSRASSSAHSSAQPSYAGADVETGELSRTTAVPATGESLAQPPSQSTSAVQRPPSQSARDGDDEGFSSSSNVHPFRSVRILQFEEFFLRRSEELLSLKEQAIAVEDFETATACRDRLTLLNTLSRAVYQREQEKVQAIIEEDFDKAKAVRDAMDRLVERAFVEVRLPGLYPRDLAAAAALAVSNGGPTGQARERRREANEEAETTAYATDDARSPRHQQRRAERDSRADGVENEEEESEGRGSAGQAAVPRSTSHASREARFAEVPPARGRAAGGSDPRAFDERPVGVSEESLNDTVVSRIDPGEVVLRLQDITPEGGIERLVANDILVATGEEENGTVVVTDVSADVRPLLQTIGPFPTACLVSRRFKLREAALTVLTEAMHEHYEADAATVEDAVLRFLDYNGFGLQDAIPNVVFAACTFVRMVLFDECGVLSTVVPQVAALLPRLLTRAADPLLRVREEALTTLTLYTKTSAAPVAPYIAAVLADPLDKERRKVPSSNPRAQTARLSALQALMEFGGSSPALASSAMTLINRLLIPAVNHPNVEVRDTGMATLRRLVESQHISLSEKDLAKVNNASLREAIISGKRGKRT